MSKYQSFKTARLLLKPTDEGDAAFMLALLNSPKWLKNIGDRNVRSLADAKEYIQNKITPDLKKNGFSNYTVIRKEDGIRIGSCGLYDRPGLEGFDIGFAYLPEYERKGYAFEAATKVRDVAFEVFKIKQISAITTKENLASQRLLEKLGLQYIKVIRIPNDEEDLLFYQITND